MTTPRHGHEPIEMRLVENYDQLEKPGDFYWQGRAGREVLTLAIPHINAMGDSIWVGSKWTINHKNNCGAQWSWNGNREAPTLTPSLHAVASWHGWVRAGKLVEA